jgi:dihydrofolate reductase
LSKVTLIGHSNGGDIAMLFARNHPQFVKKIISLDSLRMPFPRTGLTPIEKVLSFDPWPYGELPVILMSSKPIKIPTQLKHVSTSFETPLELVKRLTDEGFKHLYIDGGITVQNFIAAHLIHELTITIAPVLLGSGRSLFGPLTQDLELEHLETRCIGGGFVQLRYRT